MIFFKCICDRLSLQDPRGAEKHLQVALKTRRRWYGREHPLVVEVEECLADILADTCADTAGWDYISSSVLLVLLLLFFVINCVLHCLLSSFFSVIVLPLLSLPPPIPSSVVNSVSDSIWMLQCGEEWHAQVQAEASSGAVSTHGARQRPGHEALFPTSPRLQAKACSLAGTLVKLGNYFIFSNRSTTTLNHSYTFFSSRLLATAQSVICLACVCHGRQADISWLR